MRREADDGSAAQRSGGCGGSAHQSGGEAEDASGAAAASAVEVTLRSLLGAPPSLMTQVKKLNLGILPVQCPPLCYKRAVNSDRAQLSHAALLLRTNGKKTTEEGTTEEPREERSAKRVKTDGAAEEQADDDDAAEYDEDRHGAVVGALLAEHDVIHRVVHIQTLAVDARHRRQGVGRRLIQRVLQRAASLERVTCVQLHVHVANDDALAFYQRLGFAEHQRIENYYRHLTPRTCLVLRRDVDSTE